MMMMIATKLHFYPSIIDESIKFSVSLSPSLLECFAWHSSWIVKKTLMDLETIHPQIRLLELSLTSPPGPLCWTRPSRQAHQIPPKKQNQSIKVIQSDFFSGIEIVYKCTAEKALENIPKIKIHCVSPTYHIIIHFSILYEGKGGENDNLEPLSQEWTFFGMDFHKTRLYMLLCQCTQVLVHHLYRNCKHWFFLDLKSTLEDAILLKTMRNYWSQVLDFSHA